MNSNESRSRAEKAWLWAASVALMVLLVPSWGLIASGYVKGRGAFDQLNYHEQVVRTFAEQLPSPDFGNYLSATTPGYHVVLAVLARGVSDSRQFLQWAGSLFTAGLIVLLARGLSSDPQRARATHDSADAPPGRLELTALLLPVVASMSVFYAATWMLPDNAGWLGVLAVWLLGLRPRFDAVTVIGGGLALAALISVRQIHLWPMALLLTAAWLGDDDAHEPFDTASDLRALVSDVPRRVIRVLLALLASAPAIGVLVAFWLLWDRTLTPPVFDDRHVGGNPAAPAFVLAVFGLLGVFFVPFIVEGLARLWVRQTWLLGLALLVGLAVALMPETTRNEPAGRYSGLWELVEKAPAPLGRSVVIVPLATLGVVLVAAWFVTLGRRDRWVMLAALVAFTAAQCASFKLWQRYTEPMALLWLALAASRVAPARSGAGQGWRVLGPLTLAAVLATGTTASLIKARPVQSRTLTAPWETEPPVLPGMVPRRVEREAPG